MRLWPWVLAVVVLGVVLQRVLLEREVRRAIAFVSPRPDAVAVQSERRSLAELCAAAGVSYPPRDVRIVVEKRARVLTLFSGDRALARYRVALGFSPAGNKAREGDGKTPEGELRVVTRNDKSKYRRFLGLSYPRPSDAWSGAVTADERSAIERAFADGTKPLWDTPLGGAVGIHGHGSARDWTSGCVALDDDAIDVLWEAVPSGTSVRIVP
ncbi:MAG: L,D-transpeptidase [Deltaproteobacteria bacterium]|nr:L,D-transpeptidase [Deltaproteobacteria bacterium]